MATSYNGWLASQNPADFGGLAKLVIRGESFAPGVRAGDVHTVLQYVAAQIDARVEKVDLGHSADDWGYNYRLNRNANNLSCHASGTAIDYNATRHPNGKRGTWTPAQKSEISRILAEVGGVVRNLANDEMHFEICASAVAVAAAARRINAPAPAAPAAPAPVANPLSAKPLLQKGSKGAAVGALQNLLNRLFPSYSKLAVDNDFGPGTDRVIREVQRRAGLTVDGKVGPATYRILGI